MDAAEIIITARSRAGISQTELAKRLNTHQSVVARWERGKTQPSFENVARVVEATGQTLEVSIGATPAAESDQLGQVVAEMRRLVAEQSRLRWIKGR